MGGAPVVQIAVAALPDWATALACLFFTLVFFTYSDTYWAGEARTFLRTSLAASVFFTVLGFMAAARTPATALWWARFVLPALYLQLAGLLEAELRLTRATLPRWYAAVYAVGGAGIAVFALPFTIDVERVVRVPDGYYFLAPGWTLDLRTAVLAAGAVVIVSVLLWRRRVGGSPRRVGLYVALAALGLATAYHDFVWARTHMTMYPTTWFVGMLAMGALWYELHGELERTHARLHTDPGTGAGSRAFGDVEGATHLRTDALGVVLCDVDRFKQVNDSYGHAAGDDTLRLVVRCLRQAAGERGQVVRMGGDEFLVLAPGRSEEEMPGILARVHTALAAAAAGDPGRAAPPVPSVSLGWAWGARGSAYLDLVARADAAMYAAKRRVRGT